MDRPSAKRRKLSPTRPASRDGLRSTPRRASFMSPTKASLARFNPNLLNHNSNSSPSRSRPVSRTGIPARGQDLRAYVLGGNSGANDESPTARATERKELEAATEPFGFVGPNENTEGHTGQKTTLYPPQLQPLAPSVRSNIQPNAEPIEDEGDLPATPQGLEDLEYDPPPRGILFSSPSKRGRPSKSLAQKQKSSPLKRVDRPLPTPEDDESRLESPTRKAPSKIQIVDVVQPDETRVQESQTETTSDETNNELRQKIRKRDRLKDELECLTEEVGDFERTVNALDNDDSEQTGDNLDLENLMRLIGTEDPSMSDPSSKPIPLSQALLSFGPFSSFIKAGPTPPVDVEEEGIPSHQPIKLDDPLPHLRVFTPFTFSSQISTPSPDSTNTTRLEQIHTVQVHGPEQLFHASIRMTVDTQHERISDLAIDSLPAWTEPELGAWIRMPSSQGGPAKNDASSICWAMGSYWDLAVKRARCWMRCQDAFAPLLPAMHASSTEPANKSAALATGDDGDAGLSWEKRSDVRRLQPYLGRRSLTMQKDGVLLEIRWAIGFDWTGEAESELSIGYGCPRSWHEVDDRKSLKKIPETFQSLVKSRGVFEAIRIMAGLLFLE